MGWLQALEITIESVCSNRAFPDLPSIFTSEARVNMFSCDPDVNSDI